MKPSRHVPYRKVISVILDGMFDEDEVGWVDINDDVFLHDSVKRFIKFLSEDKEVHFYEIFHHKFQGPSSSGYPNCCTVYLGLYHSCSAEMEIKLEKLIDSFSY